MKPLRFFFCCLCLLVPVIYSQDVPAPSPDEFTEPPVIPSTTAPPATPVIPVTVPTTTVSVSKEPEETTPSPTKGPNVPEVGPPHFQKNIFKWTQYRQYRK